MTDSVQISVENLKKVYPAAKRSDAPVTVFQNLWFRLVEVNSFV